GNFFEVLSARPVLGRLLRTDDDSASHVMVLSYDAWHRLFGGDPAIIGHQLRQGNTGRLYTVVGVAEPGLDYPSGSYAWMPAWGNFDIDVIGRLAPGASPAAARSEFFAMAQRVNRERAAPVSITGSDVRTLRTAVVGNARASIIAITAAVGLLLLIVCVNVGNLLLLRAASRSRELALRRALGASYADVVRQWLTESSLLAGAGGALGLGIAELARRALIAAAPAQLPRVDMLRVDAAPVGAAAVMALIMVILFGLLPSLTAVRGRRTRQLLVASQVALALIMLAGAGLLARSLRRLETIRLGYATDHLGVLQITFPMKYWDSLPNLFALGEEMTARIATVPGVKMVTPVLTQPFLGANVWTSPWEIEGQSAEQTASNPMVPEEV